MPERLHESLWFFSPPSSIRETAKPPQGRHALEIFFRSGEFVRRVYGGLSWQVADLMAHVTNLPSLQTSNRKDFADHADPRLNLAPSHRLPLPFAGISGVTVFERCQGYSSNQRGTAGSL